MASTVDLTSFKVAFIPGTGSMGTLLAGHLAKAGLSVFVGSRSSAKGLEASKLLSQASSTPIEGGSNEEAAAWGNIIFWSPFGELEERAVMLKSLAPHLENKIIIDITNVFYHLDESQWGQTSSVLMNQKALGVPARWTTAFKSTYANVLKELPKVDNPHHTFVVGDDEEAVATTIAIVEAIPGFKALRAGGLRNSKLVELLGPRWLGELDILNAGGNQMGGWRYGL